MDGVLGGQGQAQQQVGDEGDGDGDLDEHGVLAGAEDVAGRRQVLEVVLGIGIKTLSNYTNHIAGTPLDEACAKAAWSKAA